MLALLGPIGSPALAREAPTVSTSSGLRYCVIDVTREKVRVFYTDEKGRPFGSIEAVQQWLHASHEHIVCATNGGIFAPDGKPLGWLVGNGVALSPINTATSAPGNFYLQPNGALRIEGEKAELVTTKVLASHVADDMSAVDVGLQSGPLLVQEGQVNAVFDAQSVSRYTRNAVCLRNPQTVLFAYSPNPVSLFDFAHALVALGCQSALYLDGHLSQLYPDSDFQTPAQRETLSVILAVTTKDLE